MPCLYLSICEWIFLNIYSMKQKSGEITSKTMSNLTPYPYPPSFKGYSMHTNSLAICEGKNPLKFDRGFGDYGPFYCQIPSRKLRGGFIFSKVLILMIFQQNF
jgi:hypothetical protein